MHLVGYTRAMQDLVQNYIRPFPGARLLDIGCGTSILLNYITAEIAYAGYAPNPRYIEASRRRYAGRPGYSLPLRQGDRTALERRRTALRYRHGISLLHHLNNAEARSLFESARAALKPRGLPITYDPVLHGRQSRLERFILNHDRGAMIRTAEQYKALARSAFQQVRVDIRTDMGWRIPGTAIIMTCTRD